MVSITTSVVALTSLPKHKMSVTVSVNLGAPRLAIRGFVRQAVSGEGKIIGAGGSGRIIPAMSVSVEVVGE